MNDKHSLPQVREGDSIFRPFEDGKENGTYLDDGLPKRLMDLLSDENREKAYQLVEQFDSSDHHSIISFGLSAQKKLVAFSHSMLEHVQKKDVSEVGDTISELTKRLNDINPDELRIKSSFLSRLFGRASSTVNEVLSRYQKASAQIDRMSVKLERNKNILLSDIIMLDKLFDTNKEYFHMLNMYIAAGGIKLEHLKETMIPELKAKAELSNDPMQLQEVEDLIDQADRLENRIYDLKISREVTIQSAPQIRLIQKTNQALISKIHTSINTTIPLWKNQVSIATTLLRQRHAAHAQKQVAQSNDELLLKNAELLRVHTLEVAREINSGLDDIETLKVTNEGLITTLSGIENNK